MSGNGSHVTRGGSVPRRVTRGGSTGTAVPRRVTRGDSAGTAVPRGGGVVTVPVGVWGGSSSHR